MATDKTNKSTTYVYGLDIGTRSIVGTVGYRQKDRFIVVAQYSKEHESRAMLDGQIHDIGAVSETIREVTDILEERIGKPLKQVCIAAAGRVLKTVTVHADLELDSEKSVTKEDIFALDSLGIEKAYEVFQKSDDYDAEMKFYCVGYSVMRYFMNGYLMNQLENHKAKEISADMIATFLPDDVVDGLYKSVELAGLEVANLTLEPIAAIELAIPDMYRMLNIALIDVGAGTSDISVTRDGSIIAYGMLPIAGDCLTEDIARHCLVDFQTAEMIKKGIADKDVVEYKDIMGIPQKIKKDEVLSVVDENLENLAKSAAEKIKELNGNKSVSAVFVVGGGGKIATYTDRVAKYLDILPERCAVRGEEVMSKIDFAEKDIVKDSLLVTPIGICLNYYEQSNNFIYVNFNEKRIKLYDNGHLAIVDAAISAEYPNEDIFPKRGESLEFTLNGESVVIRGGRGETATVWLNGKETDIHASIRSNDVIKVDASTAGEKATMVVSKLPEYHGNITVRFEEKDIVLPKLASVNGRLQSAYYEIQDGDEIELLDYYTVFQILEFMDIDADTVDEIYVNHEYSDLTAKVYNNFTVALHVDDTEDDEEAAEDVETWMEQKNHVVHAETAGNKTVVNAENKANENKNAESRTSNNENGMDVNKGKKPINKNGNDMKKTSAAGNTTGGMSAIERAKADAQKTLEQLQFEHAEEALMAMIQSAMSGSSGNSTGGGSNTGSVHATNGAGVANKAGAVQTKPLKIEKSARELYGSIQNNLNRLKKGTSITEIRDEAIENEGGVPKVKTVQKNAVKNMQVHSADKAVSDPVNVKESESKTADIEKSAKETENISKTEEIKASESENTTENTSNTQEQQTAMKPQVPPEETESVGGKLIRTIHVIVNNELVTMKGKTDYIYVDVFQFYEFDLSKPQGPSVETLINGRKANYTEPLSNGDELEIFWRDNT